MVLDIEYIRKNKNSGDLIIEIGINAVYGLISTVIIIGAINIIFGLVIPGDILIKIAVCCAVVCGVICFAVGIHKTENLTFSDVWYTRKIITEELWWYAAKSIIVGVVFGIFITIMTVLIMSYSEVAGGLWGCATASSAFLLYIFRNKLQTWKDWAGYIGYGCITGFGMYGLGAAIVLAIGMIGYWLTVMILVLETVFTGVYTYMGLLEWVEDEKELIRKSTNAETLSTPTTDHVNNYP